MIEIITPGALSTVQDQGRFGAMKNGFTQNGAMDGYSMRIANRLCGNDQNAPVIEMTMLGITAKFTEEHVFAISGGRFDITLNGEQIRTNKAYRGKAGDILSVNTAKSGMRCYLAVAGGFDVPLFMNSASTDIKLGIGGYGGRKLRSGDVLEIGDAKPVQTENREIPENVCGESVTLRVVLGPQDSMFTETDIAFFSKQEYTVTPDLDRMGIRLNGIKLRGKESLEIISDAITFGSVQITRLGLPIILTADHQTTGGYAKIATVISSDFTKLAQLRPYDKVRFEIVSIKQAERSAAMQKKYIENLFKR